MKKRVLTICCALLAAYVGAYLPSKLHVTTTASLSHRVFWQSDFDSGQSLETGDYVSFMHVNPWSEAGEKEMFTKGVGCSTGETLRVTQEKDFYCNDKFLGRALDADRSGDPLPFLKHNGKIPSGMIFTLGTDEYSYDSRYYGFIDINNVKYLLKPIF